MRVAAMMAGVALAALAGVAAAEPGVVAVSLKNHVFTPSTINVAAGQRVQIELTNQDSATEEFDSHDLQIEKLVTPHGKARFFIGPLKPGTYSFMGEFHPATAQGHVVATQGR